MDKIKEKYYIEELRLALDLEDYLNNLRYILEEPLR